MPVDRPVAVSCGITGVTDTPRRYRFQYELFDSRSVRTAMGHITEQQLALITGKTVQLVVKLGAMPAGEHTLKVTGVTPAGERQTELLTLSVE